LIVLSDLCFQAGVFYDLKLEEADDEKNEPEHKQKSHHADSTVCFSLAYNAHSNPLVTFV
jgi:hypothetical protein